MAMAMAIALARGVVKSKAILTEGNTRDARDVTRARNTRERSAMQLSSPRVQASSRQSAHVASGDCNKAKTAAPCVHTVIRASASGCIQEARVLSKHRAAEKRRREQESRRGERSADREALRHSTTAMVCSARAAAAAHTSAPRESIINRRSAQSGEREQRGNRRKERGELEQSNSLAEVVK